MLCISHPWTGTMKVSVARPPEDWTDTIVYMCHRDPRGRTDTHCWRRDAPRAEPTDPAPNRRPTLDKCGVYPDNLYTLCEINTCTVTERCNSCVALFLQFGFLLFGFLSLFGFLIFDFSDWDF